MSSYQIRRADDRPCTSTDWLQSRHSFSFGQHYEPDNTSFGVLLAHNDDVLAPGSGFDSHPHRELEILTWVVEGELEHLDSEGRRALVRPGVVQLLSAGTGIRHTERNSGDRPLRLVQMWLSPDQRGLAPEYRQLEVTARLGSAQLVPVASGLARHRDSDALPIRQRAAALSVARLPAGAQLALPAAPYVHVFLSVGSVTVQSADGQELSLTAGDALRITDGGGEQLSVGTAAELLVWEMHANLA
jgi:redox-sensitive bicupin YhaK (pirin superfamily)